jgi:hypothetical protein
MMNCALTTGNLVYFISTKGARRVWPVSRWYVLLLGTWSYLYNHRLSELPYTRLCISLLGFWLRLTQYSTLWQRWRLTQYSTLWQKWLIPMIEIKKKTLRFLHLGTLSSHPACLQSVLAHLLLCIVIPTFILRLITVILFTSCNLSSKQYFFYLLLIPCKGTLKLKMKKNCWNFSKTLSLLVGDQVFRE